MGGGGVGSGGCAAGSAGPERGERAAWAAWDGGAGRKGLAGRGWGGEHPGKTKAEVQGRCGSAVSDSLTMCRRAQDFGGTEALGSTEVGEGGRRRTRGASGVQGSGLQGCGSRVSGLGGLFAECSP